MNCITFPESAFTQHFCTRGEIQCKDGRAPKWGEALCTPVRLNSPRRPYTLGAKEVSGMTQKRSVQGDVCNRGVGPAANWKIKKKKKSILQKVHPADGSPASSS